MRMLWGVILSCLVQASAASDLLRTGNSAAAMGSANIQGLASDTLAAVAGNPALLAAVGHGNQLNLSALYVDSQFRSKLGERAAADHGPGLIPEFALSRPIANSRWFWGAGVTVNSAMRADFEFVDPAGTLGVSYGDQTHRSEFLIASLAGSIAYAATESLSVGWSLGLAYNRNALEAPYIFQTHPALQGLKVLVDLEADDIALTSTFGLSYQMLADWKLGLAYTLKTEFSADGDLRGNLGQLGMGVPENFSYDANVKTALPASLVAGLTWQATPRLQLGLQYHWIGWEDAFADLPIRLTNGSNADLNAFLGTDSINDTAPLDWHDQHVIHLGGRYVLPGERQLRLGLEHGNAMVPRATVTPMTGAILETALSAGLTLPHAGTQVDIAYRVSAGPDLRVGTSGLQAGEYSGTSQSLRLHSLAVSFAF